MCLDCLRPTRSASVFRVSVPRRIPVCTDVVMSVRICDDNRSRTHCISVGFCYVHAVQVAGRRSQGALVRGDAHRAQSAERGTRAGSVFTAATTKAGGGGGGGNPYEKLRRAEDVIAEQKRVIAERELTIKKQQDDLKYRSRRMIELEKALRDRNDELATLRSELDAARNARVYRG